MKPSLLFSYFMFGPGFEIKCPSSLAMVLRRKRELFALLQLCSYCRVGVCALYLFRDCAVG